MKYLAMVVAALGVMLAWASVSGAGSRAGNRAYVQSGPGTFGDVFYARCVPKGDTGTMGRTEVFRVRAEGDERVDRYEWFAGRGLVLGWSPIAGKVAVLAMMRDEPAAAAADWTRREQLRFSMGGAQLASYTNADLMQMGARQTADSVEGLHADYHVIGCEQISGTNEYDFVVVLGEGNVLRFDITTGRLRERKKEVR